MHHQGSAGKIARLLLLTLCASGCGSDPSPDPTGTPDAAGLTIDADTGPMDTNVVGLLDGANFILTYSDVEFGDPVSTVCASNVPIVAPDCGFGDASDKFIFLGRFGYNDQGNPQWGLGLTQIHRLENGNQTGEIAKSGTLEVPTYDEAGGRVALTFAVEFSSGTTQGRIAVGF